LAAILSCGLERPVDVHPLDRNAPAEAADKLNANLIISLSPSTHTEQSPLLISLLLLTTSTIGDLGDPENKLHTAPSIETVGLEGSRGRPD